MKAAAQIRAQIHRASEDRHAGSNPRPSVRWILQTRFSLLIQSPPWVGHPCSLCCHLGGTGPHFTSVNSTSRYAILRRGLHPEIPQVAKDRHDEGKAEAQLVRGPAKQQRNHGASHVADGDHGSDAKRRVAIAGYWPILRSGLPAMRLRSMCSKVMFLVSGTRKNVKNRNRTLKPA